MREILILTPSLAENDAVGNDVLLSQKALNEGGFKAYVYAEWTDAACRKKVISKEELSSLILNPNNLIIYHHSIYWEGGEEILIQAACPISLRYHNITPPQYFKKNLHTLWEILSAKEQTKRLLKLKRLRHFLTTSTYNAEELIREGASRDNHAIIAPFHRSEAFEGAGDVALLKKSLTSQPLKVLFVGRIMPHKGQLNLVRMIDRYVDLYGPDIRLYLVGKSDGETLKKLEDFVNLRRLGNIVHVHNDASFEELATYYRYSDLFVVMSEHEGFGVPLLEAQYHRLPVVSLARAALPETLGSHQILFDSLDFDRFCAAIHVLGNDKKKRDFLAEKGLQNYEKYTYQRLKEKLVEAVGSI